MYMEVIPALKETILYKIDWLTKIGLDFVSSIHLVKMLIVKNIIFESKIISGRFKSF